MKLIRENQIIIKKSRFIAYYFEVYSVDDVNEALEYLRKNNKNARHIPYAYKLSNTAGKSDDKEPSGTAAAPIYNILEMKHIDNGLIAVVRYFGGTKLGAGNLLRAYSNSAKSVIE